MANPLAYPECLLAELQLPMDKPEEAPPFAWLTTIAPAVATMKLVIASHFPDHTEWILFPACEQEVLFLLLRKLKRDADAGALAAAFAAMRGNEGGRAVLALCNVARRQVALNSRLLDDMAAHANLEEELRCLYNGKPCLPVLLAAARYYRSLVAGGKGIGGADSK